MEDMNRFNPFVVFSNGLFSRAELNQSILYFQHNSSFNINIIFYLLWFAKSCCGRLTKKQLKILQTEITLWHQRIISELKYTYSSINSDSHLTASKIKQVLGEEIVKANVVEQIMLFEMGSKTKPLHRTPTQKIIDACMSMIYYCELKNNAFLENDQSAFKQLLCVVFNDVSATDVEKQASITFNQMKTECSAQLILETF
jgi:hypothetical protein